MCKDTTDGARAEAMAADFLSQRGLRVVARNYRVRGGEIDLICREGATLVFVEVRLRRSRAFGGAAASIGKAKQARLLLAAQSYLQGKPSCPCRFDAILLERLDGASITWLQGIIDDPA